MCSVNVSFSNASASEGNMLGFYFLPDARACRMNSDEIDFGEASQTLKQHENIQSHVTGGFQRPLQTMDDEEKHMGSRPQNELHQKCFLQGHSFILLLIGYAALCLVLCS